MYNDLRYALRMLRKNPGFTAVAVLTLALGIGATSAIFSIVDAVVLRPLPVKNPDRVLVVWESLKGRQANVTAPNFVDWQTQNQTFEQMAAVSYLSFNLSERDEPERLNGAKISANYFTLLGIEPLLGRHFLAEEDQPGGAPAVLISHAVWERRFGSDLNVIGKTIVLDRQSYTIVGVMPAKARLRSGSEQLWVPLGLGPEHMRAPGSHLLSVFARLRPGVTREQASMEMAAIARRLEEVRPDSNKGWSVVLVPLHEAIVGDVQSSLLVLLGAVGTVLLIACTNVANLLLARGTARHKEIAIRTALGAGRLRLVRQLLTESTLLALTGGALGLLLTLWLNEVFIRILPANTPRLHDVTIDHHVLGFTLLVSLLTAVIFGLVPALRTSGPSLNESLKEGGRGSTEGIGRSRLRGLLVVAEVALSLSLLVGAGLLMRSFFQLWTVEPGFNPANLLTVQIALPEAKYSKPHQIADFYQQVLQHIEPLPGVLAVGTTTNLPFAGSGFSLAFYIEGRQRPAANEVPTAFFRGISPDYFRALGVGLLRGRPFSTNDREGARRVAIINQTMARRHWSNDDPIGQRFTMDDSEPTPAEVVGVVADVKHFGLDSEPQPEIFVPYTQAVPLHWQWLGRSMRLAIRSGSKPAGLIAAVRGAVSSVDKQIPVYGVTSLDELLAESVLSRRVYMTLVGLFALMALVLAAIGIYGVVAYSVSQQAQEIGIRLALGAQTIDILRLVLRQGMALVGVGLVVGLGLALGLTRLLSSMLFGVKPSDPLTYGAIVLLLVAVALLACLIPARRATKVDPIVALRCE